MLNLLRDDQNFIGSIEGINPDDDAVLEETSDSYDGLWRSPGAFYRVKDGNKFECVAVDDTRRDSHWIGQIAMIIHEIPGNTGFATASQAFLNSLNEEGVTFNWRTIYVEMEKNRIIKYFPDALLNDNSVYCRYGRIEILERVIDKQPRHGN